MTEARPAGKTGGVPDVLSPARYLAWLYSTPEQQPMLAALCEIEREIAASLRPGVDHHVAHTKLQWWQDECVRCAQGKAVHPLTRQLAAASTAALQAVATDGGVATAALAGVSGFVDTAVWDLASATFETRKELTAYCERWATAMFETAASPGPAWRALGAAVREIELLSHLDREAHVGRLRVPLDELDRAGVDAKSLARTPWPAPLAALLRDRHAALRAAMAESIDQLNARSAGEAAAPPSRGRGLLVWAALARNLSLRAERNLPDIIAPSRLHAFSDGWHAWRAARRAASGNFQLR